MSSSSRSAMLAVSVCHLPACRLTYVPSTRLPLTLSTRALPHLNSLQSHLTLSRGGDLEAGGQAAGPL